MTKLARIGACIGFLFVFLATAVFAANTVSVQPENQNFANIDKLKAENPTLDGSDISIAVICRSITYLNGQPQNDYLPDVSHDCFRSAKFNFFNDNLSSTGISDHSTAVCSILFGSDRSAKTEDLGEFQYQSIVPAAKGNIYEFWYFLRNNVFVNTAPQADIISASIGSVFEDWWTRGIESIAEHNDMIIVSGIGNGADAHEPPLFPGAGSNVIGVGVADTLLAENESFDESPAKADPETSSCGPTYDGRSKPDLVAPSDMLVASANDPGGYELSGDYTSFAAPTVSGTIALLLQYARSDDNIREAFESAQKNTLIKTILMNSAAKLPYWHKGKVSKDDDHFAPLDRIQGAGMLDALAAHEILKAGNYKSGDVPNTGWDSDELKTDLISEKVYKLNLDDPNDKIITATVCFNRHFEKSYPFNLVMEKDADIRLELWAVDTTGRLPDKLVDFSDSKIDNVEHIYCPADSNYTEYEIVAVLTNTDNSQDQISQKFSIGWSVTDKPKELSDQWYDLDFDGQVDGTDLTILINNVVEFNQKSDDYITGDINQDGVIDIEDIDIFWEYLRPSIKENQTLANS